MPLAPRRFPHQRASASALGITFALCLTLNNSNSLSSQPKPQPKSAASTKTTAATRGRGKLARGKGAARNARPAKKTAEELDSEMVDYWQAGAAATETNGAAQPAAGGDANMDDEILVGPAVTCLMDDN